MRSLTNSKLGIGVPCSFPFVPISFVNSFIMMDRPNFEYITCDNGPIDTLRNDIVSKALQTGCTKLIMLDVDQIYPTNTITKLLKHDLPVVGAKIHRRYPPFDPILLRLGKDRYEPIEDYEPGSLVEVDATGGGCVMFDMKVFKELPKPWFRFQKDEETGMTIGEDIGFFQDLKEAGYKIFVDTSVEIGHLTTMIVNQATHSLYKAMKTSKENKNAALGVMEEIKEAA
jgi:hypothetical protein